MNHVLFAGLIVLSIALGGCAPKPGQSVIVAPPFITKDTGQLTIERQQFINTWASAQVLFDGYVSQAKLACAKPGCVDPTRCAQLPDIVAQGQVIKMTVDAKLRNPEAEIDWENVAKILGLIAKFVI